jgi:hypothetical protein
MSDLAIALLIFAGVIIIMVLIRMRVGENFVVKQSDIVLALIPILLWLLLTDRIDKFEFGGIKIQRAFLEASEEPITEQISKLQLPVESIRLDAKRGVGQIPQLIKNKTEGLFFQIGYSGYYGPAIEDYLSQLTQYSFFKYVIILDEDHQFIGMCDARELHKIFRDPNAGFDSRDFEDWLRKSNREALTQLPSYISREHAIEATAEKRLVLEKMESLNLDILPVVDEESKFSGVVDRSRLTASMLIDVANRVK